jgi:hypothetical protein
LDEEEAIVGEDSKRRAVVKKRDQLDQERPPCRSGLTKSAGAACNYTRVLRSCQKKQEYTVTIKSNFMRGANSAWKRKGTVHRLLRVWRRAPD